MATECSWPEWTCHCCVWTAARRLCWPVTARDLFLWRNNHLGAFTFLCLQELRTQRWGNASNSCGLELRGELCTECLNTRRKLNASGVGYWKNLRYFGVVLYSGGTGESPSCGISRKMGLGCTVLNHLGLPLPSSLLSLYFGEGFWKGTTNFSCDVLLSKGFHMWTHFTKMLSLKKKNPFLFFPTSFFDVMQRWLKCQFWYNSQIYQGLVFKYCSVPRLMFLFNPSARVGGLLRKQDETFLCLWFWVLPGLQDAVKRIPSVLLGG